MVKDSYTCANCHETYAKCWSDEEAQAEYDAAPYNDGTPTVVVCDDCFQEMEIYRKVEEALSD